MDQETAAIEKIVCYSQIPAEGSMTSGKDREAPGSVRRQREPVEMWPRAFTVVPTRRNGGREAQQAQLGWAA